MRSGFLDQQSIVTLSSICECGISFSLLVFHDYICDPRNGILTAEIKTGRMAEKEGRKHREDSVFLILHLFIQQLRSSCSVANTV